MRLLDVTRDQVLRQADGARYDLDGLALLKVEIVISPRPDTFASFGRINAGRDISTGDAGRFRLAQSNATWKCGRRRRRYHLRPAASPDSQRRRDNSQLRRRSLRPCRLSFRRGCLDNQELMACTACELRRRAVDPSLVNHLRLGAISCPAADAGPACQSHQSPTSTDSPAQAPTTSSC